MGSSASKKIDKKKKRRNTLIYEYCICSFALVGTILAVIDILQGLAVWQQFLEWGILIILTIDYFVRLILADNKKVFIKENIFNLIAILPFHSIFRIFRVSRLFKLLSLS
ncbi:MAG TPA: Ion channel, partial [Lachnospiraceae bacterium]|nr:Ion channel [Lachnospiraceae bacterium]